MCLIAAVKAASSSLHPASAGGLDDVVLLRRGAELTGSSDRIRLMASGPRPQRVPSPRRGGPVACHDRTGMASSLVLPAGSRRQTSGETRGSPLSKERERGGASRANRNGVYPVVLPEGSRRSTSGATRGSPLLRERDRVRCVTSSEMDHTSPQPSPSRRGSAVVLHERTGMIRTTTFSRKASVVPPLEQSAGPRFLPGRATADGTTLTFRALQPMIGLRTGRRRLSGRWRGRPGGAPRACEVAPPPRKRPGSPRRRSR